MIIWPPNFNPCTNQLVRKAYAIRFLTSKNNSDLERTTSQVPVVVYIRSMSKKSSRVPDSVKKKRISERNQMRVINSQTSDIRRIMTQFNDHNYTKQNLKSI